MNKLVLAFLLPLCIIIVSSWLLPYKYNTLSGRQPWNQQQQLDGKVLELDDSNFEAAISTFDYILVDFCVSRCRPCKHLGPELDKASQMLYGLKEPTVVARVNADLNTRVSRKYGIKALPTIKIFKHGVPTDYPTDYYYNGRRNAGLLVSFVRKFVGTDVAILESDSAISDFVEAAGTNLPIFLGFGLNESTILNVAIKYKVRAWFAVAKGFSESTMHLYDFYKEPALVALHPSCDWRSVAYGLSEEDVVLEKYVNSSLFPRVWQINQDTVQLLKDNERKIVVTIIENEADYESKELIELLKYAASANPDLVFGYVGIKQWPYFAESFGVNEKTRLPKMVVWDGNDRYLLMRNKSRYAYYRSLLNLAWNMVSGSKNIIKKDRSSQITQLITGYRRSNLIEKHISDHRSQIGFMSLLIRRILWAD